MLKKMITNQWSTRGRGYTDTGGSLSFRGFGGTYLLTISANGLTKSVSIRVGDGTEAFQKITFDKNEALPEEQTATVKPRVDAQNILQELYQAGNWSETMSKVRSGKILQAISSLKHLYDDGEYALVIEQGRVLLENPFQINMSGRPSEFNGFAPLFVDPEGDTVIGSPPGTDLGAVYAFADSSNLYLGIVVIGDHPSKNATYTAVIQVDLGTFYVVLRNGSYAVHQPNHLTECSCWQEPWENGNIWFGCAHAVDDIVEIRVPLLQLGSPRRILLTGLWVWRDLTVPLDRYDGYDGPRVDIPNLRSFNATSILGIETTTAAASTVTPSTEPTASGFQGSLSYIAVTCGLVILGVAAVYIKTLRSRRRNLRDA
jgi:hypothetical protein